MINVQPENLEGSVIGMKNVTCRSIFYLLFSANEYTGVKKKMHILIQSKTCDCSRVEMDARDFLWGFFFTSIRSDMCAQNCS